MPSSRPDTPDGTRISHSELRPSQTGMRRETWTYVSQAVRNGIDLGVLVACFLIAFIVRFDGRPSWTMMKMALLAAPYVALMKFLWLAFFGVPQFAWRYVGLREALRILHGSLLGTATLVAFRLAAPTLVSLHPVFRFTVIPFGAIAIDGVLSLVALTGVRTIRRWMVERIERAGRPVPADGIRTLIVGAGAEGFALVRELDQHPELGVDPIGFVDDDPTKFGTRIHGIRVLGSTADLRAICRRHDVEQAILALPETGGARIRSLLAAFDGVGIPVRVLPHVSTLVGKSSAPGKAMLRAISLEDLLRRAPVELDDAPVADMVRGRTVLVTGAGGSIGSEIGRQLARFEPAHLVLVDQSEFALYEIERELRARHPGVALSACIADVCDEARIRTIFAERPPAIVVHAAAHKHVPMLEENVGEAVKNNLGGTRVIAEAAVASGADAFVLVSTDKAVNPTSVMGASKRAAEMLVQRIAARSATRCVAVRFGNVLGSSGSVVPLFQEQIARGGPVTVTHPEMRRYFMTVPEACNLVLHAGALARGGEIFILDMGEPIRIVDLAEDLIRLSGYVPHRDVTIAFSGMRPGEKLFEELSVDSESTDATRHPRIFVVRARAEHALATEPELHDLVARAAAGASMDELRTALHRTVPEFARGPAPDAS